MTETNSRVAGVTEEWLATAVVRESAEAIVVTDPAGIIVLWNDGAARIFGFAAAEVMGQSLDVIIPEKLRERHWKGYFQTMATGYTRYGDKLLSVPATHRDGQRLSIEFSVALLRDDAGQIVGISAIMREVTERRKGAAHQDRRTREPCGAGLTGPPATNVPYRSKIGRNIER